MDQRTPRAPVREEAYSTRRVSPAGQVVQHDVEAQTRRRAVHGRVPHRDDDEVAVAEGREPFLRAHLRLRIGRQRSERRALVEKVVGSRSAVHRAGRGEHEPPHPRVLCGPCHLKRSVEIDVVRPALVEITDGIVRKGSQVDDRVEPLEIGARHVAYVASGRRDGGEIAPEVTSLVETGVEPDHVVTRLSQLRGEHRADVAVASGYENAHGTSWVVHGESTTFGA